MAGNPSPHNVPDDAPWRDAELLEELYEEHQSVHKVGEILGCNGDTVWRWMQKHELERNPHPSDKPPHFRTNNKGRELWQTVTDGDQVRVQVSRLLAVAEFGFGPAAGVNVHHKSGIPWDNRHENLELMEHGRHSSMHKRSDYGDQAPYRDGETLYELYVQQDLGTPEIADRLDTTSATIYYWLDEHDIERRSRSNAAKL
jgi:hypothetical protein